MKVSKRCTDQSWHQLALHLPIKPKTSTSQTRRYYLGRHEITKEDFEAIARDCLTSYP